MLLSLFKKYNVNSIFSKNALYPEYAVLFSRNFISCCEWINTVDIELIAIMSKANPLLNLRYFSYNNVGFLSRITEINDITQKKKFIILESFSSYKCVTILIGCTNHKIFNIINKQIQQIMYILSLVIRDKNMTITHGTIEIVSIIKLLHFDHNNPIGTNLFNFIFITSLQELLDRIENIKIRTKFKAIYS